MKNRYPLPPIDNLLISQVFSKINLPLGYHQLKIKQEDELKTTFQSPYVDYEFLVMPFGLTTEPAALMDLINRNFELFLDKFMVVFIHDILVFTKSHADHEKHLRIVLRTIRKKKLFAKLSKCEFWLDQVDFLGHLVTKDEIFVDPRNIEAIVK